MTEPEPTEDGPPGRRRAARPPSAHARAALVLAAGLVVYLTLMPFGLKPPGSIGAALEGAASFDSRTATHIVPALLLTLLVRAGFGLRPVRAAAAVLAALIALELLQVFAEHRHARLGDLLAQAIGVGVACVIRPPMFPAPLWRAVWVAVLLLWVGLSVAVGVRGQFGHGLGPMDRTFRLVVGDEHGGGRPWLGAVHSFAIEAGDAPESATTLAIYSGPPGGEGPWSGEGPFATELHRSHGGWSSVGPVRELIAAIDSERGAGVRLDLTPATLDQTGPARIVSLSKGLSFRNLTIGQTGDALVCRIRTPRSGRNAASPQFVFPGVFEAGERRELRVWTEGGSARLWIGGEPAASEVSYITPRDWLGLEPGAGDAAGVIALFAPIGLAAGMLLGGRRSRWIVGLGLPIAIIGVIWGASLVLDRPIAWRLMPISTGVSALGVGVSSLLGGARGRGGDG